MQLLHSQTFQLNLTPLNCCQFWPDDLITLKVQSILSVMAMLTMARFATQLTLGTMFSSTYLRVSGRLPVSKDDC